MKYECIICKIVFCDHMKLIAYSKALYSTWLYYSPDRILFDAGESASSILGNKSFAIKRVFLSHGHADHIAGLLSLINIRNNAMGEKEKPLYIYYPKGNYYISELMNYISRTNRHLKYDLEWIPMVKGNKETLLKGRNDRYIEAFPTVHTQGEESLGYNIIENRERLKDEYRDLAQSEIKKLVEKKGREAITEGYEQKIFTYGGDSVPINPNYIKGTEVLCHDVTFLDEKDRKEYKHAALEEALQVAKEAEVKKEFLGIHISSRYKYDLKEYSNKLKKLDLSFKITLIPPGRIFSRD